MKCELSQQEIEPIQLVLRRGIAAAGHAVKKPAEQGEETKPAMKQKTRSARKGSPRRTR